ncbi:cupin [Halobacillus shinanisalinarum]|uniref:Cupin n=1 Tax=Halobacillus shinanisalinarum TaxID=2932258 RepID=A0ABY4H3H6_9BACI|nr:cupin [Halobacillus shinanisalinarum]UOQ95005.1 cupin [Halobacillus shinanisalinarum]
MKIFKFNKEVGKHITKFDSNFIMSQIVNTESPAHIGCMYLEAKGKIAYHQAVIPQLLLVLSGKGGVCGEDKEVVTVEEGNAVFREQGEWHETITEQGLTAVVIESKGLDPSVMRPR